MFDIRNSIPFKNGIMIQGKFTVPQPKAKPGDIFEAFLGDVRIGMVRLTGILDAGYMANPKNPEYKLAVSYPGDYRSLIGATLRKLETT